MKTSDVLKTGIDRNFLRKCIDEGIITPHKQDSDTIIHKQYIPQEYSQEDVETVWNAYLYRKLGLSYDQIKKLKEGQEISLRSSLNSLIKKYEDEIEELQAIIEFIKYAKAFGFIPAPPQKIMGSQKFKDYLYDFIDYIDADKKIKKSISVMEFFSEIEDFESINESDLNNQIATISSINPYFDIEKIMKCDDMFFQLSQNIDEDPASEIVQTIIEDIYLYQKEFNQDPEMTAWDFGMRYLNAFTYDSDLTAIYKKTLGEKVFEFFISALVEFIKLKEPEKLEESLKELEAESNE